MAENFERCMHQKEGFDAYCIKHKDHEGNNHTYKSWFWFHSKGLI